MKSETKKRIGIIAIIFIIVLIALFVIYYFLGTNKKRYGLPYTKGEILSYLKDNYNEDFTFKYDINTNDDNKVYVYSPVNDNTLEFYVYDLYTKPSIIFFDYSSSSRELYDTYTKALINKDLSNIKNVYQDVSIKDLSNNKDYYYLKNDSLKVELELNINYSYEKLDEGINHYIDVYNYIRNNLSKYKNKHTDIVISDTIINDTVNSSILNFEDTKEKVINKLIYNYRENGNQDIYNIPSSIKANYKVENIGYGNKITKVFVNSNKVDINENNTIKMIYYNGCLRADIYDIFDIIPELNNKFNKVDYSSFNNLDKIDGNILFAYLKDNNIYIISQDNNDHVLNLYNYNDGNVTSISWQQFYTFNCNDELKEIYDKYFGVKVSYDFDNEILNFEY